MTSQTSTAIKKRKMTSLFLNIIIVVMELIGTSISIKESGISLFQFYTVDSNILMLIASAVFAIYTVRSLKDDSALPQWVKTLKYMATCCLTVTFVVVICVLAPTMGAIGYQMMLLHGSMLYHHLICPMLALTSFIFLEEGPPSERKYRLFALTPPILYAAVAVTLNIAKVMDGPYPFLHVYEQPVYMSIIWFAAILGGAYFMAWLLLKANKKCSGKFSLSQQTR